MITPLQAKRIRKKTGLSQTEFGEAYKLPTATIRSWEQGVNVPREAAENYLLLIKKDPKLIARMISKVKSP